MSELTSGVVVRRESPLQLYRRASISRGTAVALVALIVVASIVVAFSIGPLGLSPRPNPNNSASTTSAVSFYSATDSAMITSPGSELCTQSPCAPLVSGWLHTNPADTNIYDGSGYVVRLVGVNAMGLEYGVGTSSPDPCRFGWGGEDAGGFSMSEFDDIASWGFNLVRLPVSWENLEPTAPILAANGTWLHNWNTAYLNEIDYFVNQFGQRHIVVILDFHQLAVSPAFQHVPGGVHVSFCEGWGEPTWLYPGITSPTTGADLGTAICNFFNDKSMVGDGAPPPIEGMEAAEQMLASRYKDNPTVVGMDLFNEPWFPRSCGTASTADELLMNYDAKVANAVSTANPHLLIVFEEPPQNLMPHGTSPILTAPPPVPNAVYEVHIYTSGWNTAQPLLQAYLNNAKKWGVPLYMGEFNAFYAGDNGAKATVDPNWQSDTLSLLAYCQTNGISWTFWSYTSLGTNVPTPQPKTEILAILREGI